MKKLIIMLLSGAMLTVGISSCDKKKITDPTLIITKTGPADENMKAGRDVTFDVTASGPNEMQGIKIEAQYESNPVEVIRDTNITGTTYFTMQAIYHIPDSAKSGEKSVLTFTVTDSKGKTASKTHTINITGSTPIITATPDRQKAPEGDTIMVTITATSKDDNIKTVKISQSVDGAQNQDVETYDNLNTPNYSVVHPYVVPPAGSGKNILLSIVATDASGDDNLVTVPLVIE